jgi:hypothetical protein
MEVYMGMLVPVNAWTVESDDAQKCKGRYRNKYGNGLFGIYKRFYNNTEETLFLNNGYRLLSYSYPRVDNISSCSKALRWENLFFCGGFSITDKHGGCVDSNDRLIEAVYSKLKPIGFTFYWKKNREILNRCLELCNQYDLEYYLGDSHYNDQQYELSFCLKNRTAVSFINSPDSIFDTYSKLGYAVDANIKNRVLEDIRIPLKDYLHSWDYSRNGKGDSSNISTGIILGYPIQSTYCYMMGRIK